MNRLKDYTVVGDPIAPRPITVEEVLQHLKMDVSLATDDEIKWQIESMIDAAVIVGETITKRTFRQSNFVAFWDYLSGGRFAYEVRVCPLESLTALTYQSGGIETVYDVSKIKIIFDKDFSRIQPDIESSWINGSDDILQAIKLSFVAGYADGELPEDLKRALLVHIGAMWADRGDCSSASGGFASCNTGCSLPSYCQTAYKLKMIMSLAIGA